MTVIILRPPEIDTRPRSTYASVIAFPERGLAVNHDSTTSDDAPEDPLREPDGFVVREQAIQDFLNTLGHDLRTPLHAILGWTRLLRAPGLRENERTEGVAVLERSAKAQADLVVELLDFAKLFRGGPSGSAERVELTEALQVALAPCGSDVASKHLEVELSPTLGGLSVECERRPIIAAFEYLLASVVCSSETSSRIEIRVGASDARALDLELSFSPQRYDAGRGHAHGNARCRAYEWVARENLAALGGGLKRVSDSGTVRFIATIPLMARAAS